MFVQHIWIHTVPPTAEWGCTVHPNVWIAWYSKQTERGIFSYIARRTSATVIKPNGTFSLLKLFVLLSMFAICTFKADKL